ncbi:MAG: hypothetical protein JWN89_200 [Parcubacteria group bacterium]|nr:hypothetical protein [Parcubacteria group bacterium]
MYSALLLEHQNGGKHGNVLDQVLHKWDHVSVAKIAAAASLQDLIAACYYAEPTCEEITRGVDRILVSDIGPKDAGWLIAIASILTSHHDAVREKLIDRATTLLISDKEALGTLLTSMVMIIRKVEKHRGGVIPAELALHLVSR